MWLVITGSVGAVCRVKCKAVCDKHRYPSYSWKVVTLKVGRVWAPLTYGYEEKVVFNMAVESEGDLSK